MKTARAPAQEQQPLFEIGPAEPAALPTPNGTQRRAGTLADWNPQAWRVADDWRRLVDDFLDSESGRRLGEYIRNRLAHDAVIYPPQPLRALELTPLAQVRIVIVGQDPYHGPGQAEGLAFSVPDGVRVPPSLLNIHKELARDAGLTARPQGGSLEPWARQGVLLLNTCLSVEDGQPASHANQGWEVLTYSIIRAVAERAQPAVFMLWGAHAQRFARDIVSPRHLVLTANHPSPLSAMRKPHPFIGCGHFSAANSWLCAIGQQPVRWT